MITYEKHVRVKNGSFTITLRGDADTDEIALIRLRGQALELKPVTTEKVETPKQDLKAGLLLLRDMVDDLIDTVEQDGDKDENNLC